MTIAEPATELDLKSALFQRTARQLLRLRQERRRQFQQIEIVGPSWPLMLALYASAPAQPCVGHLAQEADLPRTTALRWLRQLQEHGIVELSADVNDRRVVRVRLTSAGRRGMHDAFVAAANGRYRSRRARN